MKSRYTQSLSVALIALGLAACSSPSSPDANTNASGGQAGASAGGTSAGSGGSASSSGGASAGGASAGSASGGSTSSTGCGATMWPEGAETPYTIDVDGTMREYIVTIPENYDPAQPHRLVFTWHGRGGSAEDVAGGFFGGYYGLSSRIGASSILVSGQGLGTDEDPTDTGWPNTEGRDIAFVRAMLDWFNANYCIDQERIFSTGMSYGGIMSIHIGCQMSDVFRGIAPIAGALFGGPGANCSPGPIAVWQTHGSADDVVMIAGGERARDAFLTGNGCGTTTQPIAPDPCVAYDGCADGYPVTWCVHPGGHTIPDFSADAIADFFQQF